jgi:hypothetical protein
VGIGTNNTTKKLHISGSGANSGISFDVDSGATAIIRGNTTANFDLNNDHDRQQPLFQGPQNGRCT